MKARRVEKEEAAVTRQQHCKHVSPAMKKHRIDELLEAVFPIRSTPRLYEEQQQL
jgi:hypothetical protein